MFEPAANLRVRSAPGRPSSIMANRESIDTELRAQIDAATEDWGVQVTSVETRDIDLPESMQRAMARQAEAERDRRAKIIAAEGEFQAARRLADAAEVIGEHPAALQLRMLQTITEVASERNSTLVLPIPMELLGRTRTDT